MTIKLTEEIAQRLRAARKAAGFKSAKDFANQHKIPLSTYSQHETGKRSINSELLINYSAYLTINPYWLLTGDGEPFLGEEHKAKNTCLEREFFSTAPKVGEQQIKYNAIDLALMKKILLAAEPLFADDSLHLSFAGLLDHCFEIYAAIAPLNAEAEEKDKVISLALSTIKPKFGN